MYVITYNHERFIDDALGGVFRQSYRPLEIVISDDASEDGTFDRILARSPPIKARIESSSIETR